MTVILVLRAGQGCKCKLRKSYMGCLNVLGGEGVRQIQPKSVAWSVLYLGSLVCVVFR